VVAGVLLAMVAVAGGCGAIGQRKPTEPGEVRRNPPKAAEFIAKHNERVAKLNRLWMRTELWLRGTTPEGEKLDEVTEGHLMVELPRNLSLTVKKLGETYFVLGSNGERYWWLDLSREERPGLAGEHAKATRERVKRFGLPVLPLDLIELLAITPIDPAVEGTAQTRWVSEKEGEIVFAVPGGSRAIRFDAKTLEPTAVELRDESGFAVVSSAMSEFEPTPIRGEPGLMPKFQRKTDIVLNELDGVGKSGTRVRVTITAYDAENRPLNPALFDLPELVKRHRVSVVRSVDEMELRP
jgi:hypothetical protein